jgi:hypothetical protein
MSEDLQAKKKARDDLNDIEALERFEPFSRLFLRRVNEELDKRRENVLHNRTLTAEELYNERLLYLAARDTAKMMENDKVNCRKLLGSVPD